MIYRSVALILSVCLLSGPLRAEEQLRLKWSEIAPVVTGKRVWLPLNGGVRVSGTVRGVEAAGLKVEVAKTSDSAAYPKGLVSIPRSSIATIGLSKPAGHKGIIIGGAVGGGVAVAASAPLIAIKNNEGGTGADPYIAAAILIPIALGLLIGGLSDWGAHRNARSIVIVHD
jgi:hypothetical protein